MFLAWKKNSGTTYKMASRKVKVYAMALVSLFLSSIACITTYRDFPVEYLDSQPGVAKSAGTLYYQIDPEKVVSVGGFGTLRRIFNGNHTSFNRTEARTEAPPEGIFVHILNDYKPPTVPAIIFGYISVATATILPAWSTEDGYLLTYDVFVNGQRKKTFTYEYTRKIGAWLCLLPFAWINFITYSEDQVMQAINAQFFHDLNQLLSGN